MQEKEKKVCILIHHIATVTGLFLSVKTLCFDRHSTGRKSALIVFLASQVWALAKILRSAVQGKKSLDQSFENIKELSKNRRTQKTATWLLTAASGLFKIGTPILLKN